LIVILVPSQLKSNY